MGLDDDFAEGVVGTFVGGIVADEIEGAKLAAGLCEVL
jgi:hypothetical protein